MQTIHGSINFEQAKHFMFSMSRDEDAGHVIRDTARQIVNAPLYRGDD